MKRDSRFETLRIFSMFLIIIYHYSLYGNWKDKTLSNQFAIPYGQIGVCLFVLISGYFISLEKINLRKQIIRIVKLWNWVLIYSWIILCITYVLKFKIVGLRLFIGSLFPIIFNSYWFVTSFIILMFLVPLLNKMISKSNKKQLMIYIVFFIVTSGILPILNNILPPFGESNGVALMITCYLIAAYVRIYKVEAKNLYLFSIICLSLIIMYLPLMLFNDERLTKGFFPIIIASSIFILITRIRPYYNSFINFMASSVFASYLITENNLLRITIWHKLLNVNQYSTHPIVAGIIIVAIIIIVTALFDKSYKLLYNLVLKKNVSYVSNYIYKYLSNYYSKD